MVQKFRFWNRLNEMYRGIFTHKLRNKTVTPNTPYNPNCFNNKAPENPRRAEELVCKIRRILIKSMGFSKMTIREGISIG